VIEFMGFTLGVCDLHALITHTAALPPAGLVVHLICMLTLCHIFTYAVPAAGQLWEATSSGGHSIWLI